MVPPRGRAEEPAGSGPPCLSDAAPLGQLARCFGGMPMPRGGVPHPGSTRERQALVSLVRGEDQSRGNLEVGKKEDI